MLVSVQCSTRSSRLSATRDVGSSPYLVAVDTWTLCFAHDVSPVGWTRASVCLGNALEVVIACARLEGEMWVIVGLARDLMAVELKWFA